MQSMLKRMLTVTATYRTLSSLLSTTNCRNPWKKRKRRRRRREPKRELTRRLLVSDPWKEEAGGLAFPPVGRSVLGSITARLLLTFLFSVLSDPLPPPGWAMCPRRDHCTNYVGRFSSRFYHCTTF